MPDTLKPKQIKPVELKQIIAAVFRRKWLIILPVLIVTGLAYAGTYLLQPTYEASTIIWIDKPANVSRELISIIGGERPVRESSDERRRKLLALHTEITSQNFLYQLIADLKLDEDPEITREAARARETNDLYSLEELKYNLLVEALREQITVSYHGYDQIKITVSSFDPVLASQLATRLTEILEIEKTRYEMEKILDNQTFTDLQLQKTEHYYQQAIDSLNRARARLSSLQLADNISFEESRQNILPAIDRAKLERKDLSDELQRISSSLSGHRLEDARVKYSDTVIELRTAIDGLVSSYANMIEKYAWNDQSVLNISIRLNGNISVLEDAIRADVGKQYPSHSADQVALLRRYFVVKEHLDIAGSKLRRLQHSLDRVESRIAMIPRLESDIFDLQARVEDARRYRDAFRSEETTVDILSARAQERTKYKVIEPAKIPLAPVSPNKFKIIMLGLALGLLIGAASVFLLELLDNSFKRVEDIEDELGLPVLATIPRIEKLKISR